MNRRHARRAPRARLAAALAALALPLASTAAQAVPGVGDAEVVLGMVAPFSGPSRELRRHRVWGTVLDASGSYRPIDLE